MKIAIPSNDKTTISGHFGRTKGFIICEVEDNKVVKKEYKVNDFTGHAQGHHHEHHHGGGGHGHNHEGIFRAIGDCSVVVARGMGKRLYDDFKAKKIQVFVTNETDIETALNLLINNELDNNSDACCQH